MEYDNSFKHRGDRPGHNWGDYQFVDHGYDQLAADPTTGVGTVIPGLNQLTATEMRGRLQFIHSRIKPAVVQALAFTKYIAQPTGVPGVGVGEAQLLLTGQTDDWLPRFVSAGNAVLMDMEGAAQGRGSFAVLKDPKLISEMAAPGYVGGDLPAPPHGMAIIDGPAALLDAAVAASVAPVPAPQPQQPLQLPPSQGMPEWLLPVGVGIGALALIGLVVTTGKKKR